MTATLNSFLAAMHSADVDQLHQIRDHNNRLLIGDQARDASSDLWSFCIGGNFITVQINTKLHSLLQSGEFSAFRYFKLTTGATIREVCACHSAASKQ
jgi:hypothetical protein